MAAPWLERFVAPVPLRRLGGLELHACRDAHGAGGRVVVVGTAGSATAAVAAALDAMAAAHRAVDHPMVPPVVARDRVGEIEFVALDCDAVVDLEALRQRLRQRTRGTLTYAQYMACSLAIGEALDAIHSTPDPVDGLPMCLGRVSWSNFLVAPGGKVSLIGLGRFPLTHELWSTTGELAAPEVTAGARPMPCSDIYAVFTLLLSLLPEVKLPPAMEQMLAGGGPPGLSDLLQETQDLALANLPARRAQSIDAILTRYHRIWALIGESPDPASCHGLFAELVGEVIAREADTMSLGDGPGRGESGKVLCGRYQLLELLGAGGMGTAYRAWDRQLEQHVTVKRLHDHASVERRTRFAREVRILRQVKHAHLVHGYDLLQDGGSQYAVMEYVEGEPLPGFVRSHAPTPAAIATLLADIADALAALHDMGVVHRDVKPSNVVVHASRGAVLIDFGIASEAGSELTSDGEMLGTPRFMSPEQRRGDAADAASDVYSLGQLIVETIATEALPEALRELVLECTREVASQRPSATEVARRLRDLAAQTP